MYHHTAIPEPRMLSTNQDDIYYYIIDRRVIYLLVLAPASKLFLIGLGFLMIEESYADKRKLRLKRRGDRRGDDVNAVFGKGVEPGHIILSNHTCFTEVITKKQ